MMSHYAALYSIVFMIAFVCTFDLRHQRLRFYRLFTSASLMTSEELDQLRMIWSACEGE
jgi:CMP-2-keto-3-deoxyoctulosonic acid synthetase